MKNKATTLINILKTENRYFTKKEICDLSDGQFILNTNKDNHDDCVKLWEVKNYINNHVKDFGVIIISNFKGELKIPTQNEVNEYLDNQMKIILKRLSRYRAVSKALNLEGQLMLDGKILEIVNRVDLRNEN